MESPGKFYLRYEDEVECFDELVAELNRGDFPRNALDREDIVVGMKCSDRLSCEHAYLFVL